MKFKSTSNILIVISILTIVALYFIELATPDQHEIFKFSYDTSFLALLIGYILRKKNIQQLIGLLFYLIVYNLDILTSNRFQAGNDDIFNFARHYSIYILALAILFLLPTLFDKYKLAPLTNETNINDTTIILTTLIISIFIQITFRLIT